MSADTIPGQLDEIRQTIKHGDAMREQFAAKLESVSSRLDAGDLRMRLIEHSVAENTTITRGMSDTVNDIRDIVEAGKAVTLVGRGATKLIKWIGALAIAGSAMYALFYQATHGGKLP